MRKLLIIILVFFLMPLLSYSQDQIPKEKWVQIVDYTNAKVTAAYIESLTVPSSLSEEDSKFYKETLKSKLHDSKLKKPIQYDTLRGLMEVNFTKTLNRVTSKIDEVKSKPLSLSELYSIVLATLKDVDKEEVYNSNLIQDLKSELDAAFPQKSVDTIENNEEKVEGAAQITKSSMTIFSYANIVIGLLVALILFVLFRMNRITNNMNDLEERLKMLSNDMKYELNGINKHPIPKTKSIRELEDKINDFDKRIRELIKVELNIDNQIIDEPKSPVVEFDNISKPKSKIFYAGKPLPDRTFTEVTDNINEQETVFKFTKDGESNRATFEVTEASKFMYKQITNAPDDFLYRVCNNVNSNQDFKREIVTERKGIAHFRNGKWVVEESDKALIKFQ